jgi:hypothetical protein
MSKLKLCSFLIIFFSMAIFLHEGNTTTTSELYVSCTVASFGGYTFRGVITNVVADPGQTEIGYITVKGACNEPYPWILRVYTDNRNYQGTAGSVYNQDVPAGLIREGGGSLPLLFQTENTGNQWVYIPDINNPNYKDYYYIRNLGPAATPPENTVGESIVVGIDPRNTVWVAGNDGILFTDDDNVYGDITLPTPFEIKLAVRTPKNSPKTKTTPHGKYSTKLIFEIISEP